MELRQAVVEAMAQAIRTKQDHECGCSFCEEAVGVEASAALDAALDVLDDADLPTGKTLRAGVIQLLAVLRAGKGSDESTKGNNK